MNGILLVFVLIVFLAVPLLNINRQKKAMQNIEQFRAQLAPGQKIETAGGLRATVVEVKGDATYVEIAPGLVVEWATQGIMRPAPEADTATVGKTTPEDDATGSASVNPVVDTPNTDAEATSPGGHAESEIEK